MERTLHRLSRSWSPTTIRRRGTLVNAGHEGQLICGLKFKITALQGFTCWANRMIAALRRPAARSGTAGWGRALSYDLLGLPRACKLDGRGLIIGEDVMEAELFQV